MSHKGTPRLRYDLDSKSVVKINYDVPITSATKLKRHKVQNWLIQTYF